MEFKGTKGKWVFSKASLSIWHPSDIGRRLVLVDEVVKDGYVLTVETQANAQLIAHAPEMLEMLKDILLGMRGENFEVTEYEIEQMIKKATTI